MRINITQLLAISGVVLFLGGCNLLEDGYGLEQKSILTVKLEDPGTKVTIDDTDGKLAWDENDVIAVYVDGRGYFNVPVREGFTSATGRLYMDETDFANRSEYAVYPAGVADDTDYGNPTLSVNLPSTYDIVSYVERGNTVAFNPLPMVAVNSPLQSILDFRHVGGLMRITCNKVPAHTKSIKVTVDKAIAGTFIVRDPGSSMPTIATSGTASGKSVIYKISDDGLAAETNGIILNVPVPCGTYRSIVVTTYTTADASGSSQTEAQSLETHTFARHHGWKVPFEELSFHFVCSGLANAVNAIYSGSVESLATSFVSYKTDGATTIPVPFNFQYSTNGINWVDGLPDWLSVEEGFDYSGSVSPKACSIKVAPQVNSGTDPHHVEMRRESRKKTDYDLSEVDFLTNHATIRTTANCYVVYGHGTYKFPLVYGNGVLTGEPNTAAYTGDFKDHLGNSISSPYLTAQLNKTADKFTPVLLWTDVPGLVNPESLTLSGEGEETYLHFEVPAQYVTQGNALIGVLVDSRLAWSWHIWVTDSEMAMTRAGSGSFHFAPKNLGWCDARTYDYARRECLVRAIQEESGQYSAAVTVSQAAASITYGGNSPYYQWGRKDPLQASVTATTFKQYYATDPAYAPSIISGPVSPGTAIQHPYAFYTNSSEGDWCSTASLHWWNVQTTAVDQTSQNVVKTIYDPSPVGFKVPPQAAMSDFDNSNFAWSAADQNGDAGRLYNPGRAFYQAAGRRTHTGALNKNGEAGFFWMAVPHTSTSSWCLFFDAQSVSNSTYSSRACGLSVRPVSDMVPII